MIRGQIGHTNGKSISQLDSVTASEIRSLVEAQGFRCAATGWELTPETASVDHINPMSQGGTNTLQNLQVLHADVNQAKGTQTMQQFVQMCRDVVAIADGPPINRPAIQPMLFDEEA